jgi:two-component system chemotaxis response regulator CheB
MPRSALENVPVDYCLPVAGIGPLIGRLVLEPEDARSVQYQRMVAMDQEPRIIEPSAQTCPECGGAMREERVGSLARFRCHIGHVMTAEVLASSQLEELEHDLSAVLRLMNERAGLCRDMAQKYAAAGNASAAEPWQSAADQALARETALKEMVKLPWQHPENAEADTAHQTAPTESAA